jgi:hypothetical protein
MERKVEGWAGISGWLVAGHPSNLRNALNVTRREGISQMGKSARCKCQVLLRLACEHPSRYYRSEGDSGSLKRLGGFAATFKTCDDDDAVGPCSTGRLRTREEVFTRCDACSGVGRRGGFRHGVCRHLGTRRDVYTALTSFDGASDNSSLHHGTLRHPSGGKPHCQRSCRTVRIEQG